MLLLRKYQPQNNVVSGAQDLDIKFYYTNGFSNEISDLAAFCNNIVADMNTGFNNSAIDLEARVYAIQLIDIHDSDPPESILQEQYKNTM